MYSSISFIMKRFFFLILFIGLLINSYSQTQQQPKLIVGIVVDQMRPEYLYRFYNQFSDNGFRRLLKQGFVCRNTHLNYVPTYTGPGHASIYSGTSPRYHGIVANDWYDRKLKRSVYCVADSLQQTIGSELDKRGLSPHNLLSTNICDELKIFTNGKANVISLSLKDRAAILPAGHMANGAFWFDEKSGNFVSSTFYMKELPNWVINFNAQKKSSYYMQQVWTPLRADSTYTYSLADDNNYETILKGKSRPVFPYDLKALATANPPYFHLLFSTPYGNSLLADFAINTLQNTTLGRNTCSDFLAISFSSTDYVGHAFGPLSKEINDTYLRLDNDIARVLNALDSTIGENNYLLFLTADHAMAEVPTYLIDNKIPAGFFQSSSLKVLANSYLSAKLGQNKWIEAADNDQFYLNRTLIADKGLNLIEIQNILAEFLRQQPNIAQVYTQNQLDNQEYILDIAARVQRGFYFHRSGDVAIVLEPGWVSEMKEGTTQGSSHGSAYAYDTNIPLIWFGANVKSGQSFTYHPVVDIAATLAAILHTKYPSACIGNPITELLGN